jgi:ribosomal protein S21
LANTEVHIALRTFKKNPTQYKTITNSWISSRIFENYLAKLERKRGAKNKKILLSLTSMLLT